MRGDAIFLDQHTDGLVRGHVLECGIIVAPADQLQARKPEVIAMAVQRPGRKICLMQPLQER